MQAFNERNIDLLLIYGRGGTGKTYTITNTLHDPLVNSGHVTPLELYCKLHDNPTKMVVFDDVDQLFNNKTMVALLKQVTQGGDDKPIRYGGRVKPGYEPEFKSNNKIIMVFNSNPLLSDNPDIKAIATRAIPIDFSPTNKEVIAVIKKACSTKVVTNFFVKHQNHFPSLDLRLVSQAEKLYHSGLDWKGYLMLQWDTNDQTALIDRIKGLPVAKRNAIWIEETGKSVRSLQLAMKASHG